MRHLSTSSNDPLGGRARAKPEVYGDTTKTILVALIEN